MKSTPANVSPGSNEEVLQTGTRDCWASNRPAGCTPTFITVVNGVGHRQAVVADRIGLGDHLARVELPVPIDVAKDADSRHRDVVAIEQAIAIGVGENGAAEIDLRSGTGAPAESSRKLIDASCHCGLNCRCIEPGEGSAGAVDRHIQVGVIIPDLEEILVMVHSVL